MGLLGLCSATNWGS